MIETNRRYLVRVSDGKRLDFGDVEVGEVVVMHGPTGEVADDGGANPFRVVSEPFFQGPTGRWILQSESLS